MVSLARLYMAGTGQYLGYVYKMMGQVSNLGTFLDKCNDRSVLWHVYNVRTESVLGHVYDVGQVSTWARLWMWDRSVHWARL